MLDAWPDPHGDLSTPNQHLIWSFRRHLSDTRTVTLCVEEDRMVRQIAINVKYCPVLACFDVEYWKEMRNGASKDRQYVQLRKYLHQLRRDIVEEIFGVKCDQLRLGTTDLMALHAWSIRTWSNFAHSLNGRQGYESRCKRSGKEPYAKSISLAGEYINGSYILSFAHF